VIGYGSMVTENTLHLTNRLQIRLILADLNNWQ